MPAWRLDDSDRTIAECDVGATDGDGEHFVGHALLCQVKTPTQISSRCPQVQAIHMGPPLKQTPSDVDMIGTAELDVSDVSRGERRRIKSFIDDRLLERRAQEERFARLEQRLHPISEYIIHPAAKEPDADYPLWRFNCAGFVLAAYAEADIELVDQEHAPLVTVDFLKKAYPMAKRRLDDPDFRKDMGIGDGDRWPVVVPGYIVNSLNRSAADIRRTPYTPEPGDEYFPSLREEHRS